jgi:hypothetical protein
MDIFEDCDRYNIPVCFAGGYPTKLMSITDDYGDVDIYVKYDKEKWNFIYNKWLCMSDINRVYFSNEEIKSIYPRLNNIAFIINFRLYNVQLIAYEAISFDTITRGFDYMSICHFWGYFITNRFDMPIVKCFAVCNRDDNNKCIYKLRDDGLATMTLLVYHNTNAHSPLGFLCCNYACDYRKFKYMNRVKNNNAIVYENLKFNLQRVCLSKLFFF